MSDTWWTHHQSLAHLWRWLVANGKAPRREIDGREEFDATDYLETPWSWTPEWEEMKKENAYATHG